MKSESSAGGVVIAKVMGGLGNQLFIYAAAKRLSVVSDVPLRLDTISGYTGDTFDRTYGLNHFRIDDAYATSREVYELNLGKRRNLQYHVNKLLPFRYKRFIREDRLFDRRLVDLRVAHRVYLEGYWQNEEYFRDIEPIIRKNFDMVSPHDGANVELARKMTSVNSVSLHARRLNYEYLLSPGYYDSAIMHIASRVANPHFFCFSDDIGWIRDNVKMDWPVTHVAHNEESKDYEDLWLMTQCRHHIISNSTFSWWGAWLAVDPAKVVIAPKDWGYRATVPKEWVIL